MLFSLCERKNTFWTPMCHSLEINSAYWTPLAPIKDS